MTLLDQIAEMTRLIDRATVSAPDVSGWSVGQQIQHCCLAMRGASTAVARTSKEKATSRLTIVGRAILASGIIPRGRAQAPESVVVQMTPSQDELLSALEKARLAVERLDATAKFGFFDHPYFGRLDQARCVRFLEIHNVHHLKIVSDILASAWPPPDAA